MDCKFCKIIKKEIPAKVIFEGKEIIGFESQKPEAPIHYLFVPKKHLEWKEDLSKEKRLIAKIILSAKKIAKREKIFKACKFIFNIGKAGHIPHIHLHLIGGWKKISKKTQI